MKRLLGGLIVLAVAAAPLLVTEGAAAQPIEDGDLRLWHQTTSVGPNGTFQFQVELPRVIPGDTVFVTVYDRVTTRFGLRTSIDQQLLGAPLGTRAFRVGGLEATDDGRVDIVLDLNDGSLPVGPDQLELANAGVYPVTIDLRNSSQEIIGRIVTHLVRRLEPPQEGASPAPPLGVALIADLRVRPTLRPDGSREVSGIDRQHLQTWTDALLAHGESAATIVLNPETLDGLAASGRADDERLYNAIVEAAVDRHVIGGPYVSVDTASLEAVGLIDEVVELTDLGDTTLEAHLEGDTDAFTRLLGPDATERDARSEQQLGVRNVIVPSDRVVPSGLTTAARPFQLELASGEMVAVATDVALSDRFTALRDPVLAAHHLLAELAVIFFEDPQAERTVVLMPTDRQTPDQAFLEVLLASLETHTILGTSTVADAVFLPLERDENGRSVTRTLRPRFERSDEPAVDSYLATRTRLDAYESMIEGIDAGGLHRDLDALMKVSLGSDLGEEERGEYWARVLAAAVAATAVVESPPLSSIRLTAREATIPLRFQNRADHPVRVRVRFESDKVDFVDFADGETTVLVLEPGVTPQEFSVRAFTSGSFPLEIEMTTPDGAVDLGGRRITIRSTALSGVGTALTFGALAFLVVWWIASFRRNKRATRRA